MFCQVIFLLAPYAFFMANAEDNCTPIQDGDIKSSDLSNNNITKVGNCIGSYIYISVPPVTINSTSDFTITINEKGNDTTNYLANINLVPGINQLEETGLASETSEVFFSCDTVVTGEPFNISYKEITRTNATNEYWYDDSQIILDPLKPNEQIKNSFWNKLSVQKFEIGYNFSSSTSTNLVTSLSSSFGFIALRNSNGKINLISGASGTNMKFVIGMPQRNISEGSNHALESYIDVVTQNDPEAEVYKTSRVLTLQCNLLTEIKISDFGIIIQRELKENDVKPFFFAETDNNKLRFRRRLHDHNTITRNNDSYGSERKRRNKIIYSSG